MRKTWESSVKRGGRLFISTCSHDDSTLLMFIPWHPRILFSCSVWSAHTSLSDHSSGVNSVPEKSADDAGRSSMLV